MRAAADRDDGPPGFPWAAVIHAGLCRLRLPARDFWAMTPREMTAALGGLRPHGDELQRAQLEMLMTGFPDGGEPFAKSGEARR